MPQCFLSSNNPTTLGFLSLGHMYPGYPRFEVKTEPRRALSRGGLQPVSSRGLCFQIPPTEYIKPKEAPRPQPNKGSRTAMLKAVLQPLPGHGCALCVFLRSSSHPRAQCGGLTSLSQKSTGSLQAAQLWPGSKPALASHLLSTTQHQEEDRLPQRYGDVIGPVCTHQSWHLPSTPRRPLLPTPSAGT